MGFGPESKLNRLVIKFIIIITFLMDRIFATFRLVCTTHTKTCERNEDQVLVFQVVTGFFITVDKEIIVSVVHGYEPKE